jgi:hypothetical protein
MFDIILVNKIDKECSKQIYVSRSEQRSPILIQALETSVNTKHTNQIDRESGNLCDSNFLT